MNNTIEGNGKKEYGQYLQKVDDLREDLNKLEIHVEEINKVVNVLTIIKESGCENLKEIRKTVMEIRDWWLNAKGKWAVWAAIAVIIVTILATLGGNWIAVAIWGKVIL